MSRRDGHCSEIYGRSRRAHECKDILTIIITLEHMGEIGDPAGELVKVDECLVQRLGPHSPLFAVPAMPGKLRPGWLTGLRRNFLISCRGLYARPSSYSHFLTTFPNWLKYSSGNVLISSTIRMKIK
jgi:hypothetical protein